MPFIGPSGRAQDQAHAALGEGAPLARYPARRHRVPFRPADRAQPEGEDLAPVRRADQRRDLARSTRPRSTRSRSCCTARAWTPSSPGTSGSTPSPTCRSGTRSSSGSTPQTEPVRIAIVGKYVNLRDAYLSVIEALHHGGFAHGADVQIEWVASDDLGGSATEEALAERRRHPDPRRVRRARRRGQGRRRSASRASDGVPFLGLCLGLQCAVIEFARNVCGLEGANSCEFDPGDAAPGDRPAARAEERHRPGRDDAPGRAAVPSGSRARWPRAPRTARRSSTSGTATGAR